MQKAVRHIGAVASRILFIGLSVQVVLGLLWMLCSFDGMQQFRATEYFLEAAQGLVCDEYMGILYPFILMLVKGIERLSGIPYAPIMYFLQVVLAFVAGYCFVSATGVKKSFWKVWGSLVLMTFPMIMQCHMAILPDSFAYSCFLLLLTSVLETAGAGRELSKDGLIKNMQSYLFWILTSLLMPEYLYLGAVPIAIWIVYRQLNGTCKRAKKHTFSAKEYSAKNAQGSFWGHLALFVVSIGIIVGINALTLEHGSQGRVQNSIGAIAFRRCCWTDFSSTYYYWPEKLRSAVSDDLLAEVVKEAENLDYFFMPKVEAVLGVGEAKLWFGRVAKPLFVKNYRLILYEMILDAGGYALPSVMIDIALEGISYSSYGMRNYELMRQDHPLLTKYYMNYSIWWFYVGLLLTAGLMIFRQGRRLGRRSGAEQEHPGKPEGKRKCIDKRFTAIVCIVSAGGMVIWYTLQNTGLWDYKKALFVGGLWMLWMIKGTLDNIGYVFECS